jgi:Sulfotransferase family
VRNLSREAWLGCIRNFVLDAARRAKPDFITQDYLVIKEPNGSIGAPLLMEALPESRMIFLVRDPRDVVASSLALNRDGEYSTKVGGKVNSLAKEHANKFVRRRAARQLQYVGNARQAYGAHQGYKALVKYEELRTDTQGKIAIAAHLLRARDLGGRGAFAGGG